MIKLMKSFKKHWITVWLVIAAITLTIITSYAVYTRITIAKRVVSTQAGAGSLFTSDYMSEAGIKSIKPIAENDKDQDGNAKIEAHVFNYVYPKQGIFRSEETEYDLIATLGKLDSGEVFHPISIEELNAQTGKTYSIQYKDGEVFDFVEQHSSSHTFTNCVIAGDKANADLFTLIFDKSELGELPNGYCLKLEAVPHNTELPELMGLVLVRYSKPSSAGWEGKVEDIDASKENDYDGFNYYLEGNGKGSLTFRWDRTKVRINKYFLSDPNNKFVGYDNGAIPVEEDLPVTDGMVSLTIKVDSTKQNRYEIQFYKVDPENVTYSKSDVEGSYLPKTDPADWVAETT